MTSKLEILDPTVESISSRSVVATRPMTLNGLRIGLLANGTSKGDELLDLVYEIMANSFAFKDVIKLNKGNASRPCPKKLMDELVDKCDVAVTATGD